MVAEYLDHRTTPDNEEFGKVTVINKRGNNMSKIAYIDLSNKSVTTKDIPEEVYKRVGKKKTKK